MTGNFKERGVYVHKGGINAMNGWRNDHEFIP